MSKAKRRFALIAAAIGTVIAASFAFAGPLLCVRSPLAGADAIVVLGGEPFVRVKAAAPLITNGYAHTVILSGHGDCDDNLRSLHQLGVRTNGVLLECESRSTHQNALYTVKLLRDRKCKSAIIVTSWFHSRRALNCFRKYAPEIQFISAPAPRTNSFRYERGYIGTEYIKLVYYAIRWRVPPWTE
jgi:uncharacterized SAM-binding protein YcdF (DUF218 family)